MDRRPKCCCCGQHIPKPELFRRPSVGHTLYAFISMRPQGVTREQMFEHLYGRRPNGGPGVGLNVISVHLNSMNEKLARKDMKVQADRRGNGEFLYTLRRLSTGNIWLPIA